MITYLKGDIFSSKLQTLTCPVNCKGVMGKGLALEFKKTFPGLSEAYKQACDIGHLRIGRPWIWKVNDVRQVMCFPTKNHWNKPSTYEYISWGFVGLFQLHLQGEIQSLALPPLGCGLGGLEWDKVKPMLDKDLGDLPIKIEVYEP
jgi:O-acetyl-ADP-ribose deacetylase (regulator of RNase III)